ncbi:MAG: hypothetical protein CL440_07410 [Acidimicrobiaceae bacterium]|nr:hypothetical protein [Acidimicrobiaceae bacterium]
MTNPLLPTTDKSIDLSILHPRFIDRLEDFFSDGRIGNKVAICSGARSYAAQKALYDRYKRGKGNLAANPDWLRPDGFFRGSFHQEQPDGFSYAVDLRIVKRGITTDEVTHIADRYGIRPTVKGEWWHFQPRNAYSWFEVKTQGSVFLGRLQELQDIREPEEPKVNWAGIQAIIDDMGRQIAVSPVRRGSKGDIVKVVQSKLNSLDFNCGIADGVFGRKTLRAVLMLQRSLLLKESGAVDHKTWTAMWKPEIPIGL